MENTLNSQVLKGEELDPKTDINNQDDSDEAKKKEKLKKEAKKFVRIGDDYYKIVQRPDKEGKLFKDYLKLNKGTIIDDHSKSILRYIEKYDDFCTVASHTKFKQIINGFFNQYNELTHKPKEGNYDTILGIISHVFGEHYLDFALDYVKIMYCDPYQRLPILLLESTQKNTGKSTFANILYKIFQDNAIKIGNNDLQSDFNSVWVKRLAIIIDEASLEKKGVTQMLKRFSTETGKVTVNEKNKAQKEVDFFGKFLFISNEEGKALSIERNDPRWAVFKVPTFQEKGIQDDPLIDEKIDKEIPAFLHFLITRDLKYQRESRMYFAPVVYQTAQLQLYYNNNLTKVTQAIKELIVDTFDLYPEQECLKFAPVDIMVELKEDIRNIERAQVIYAVEQELGLKLRDTKTNYTIYSRKYKEANPHYTPPKNAQSKRYYVFWKYEAETWKSTNW